MGYMNSYCLRIILINCMVLPILERFRLCTYYSNPSIPGYAHVYVCNCVDTNGDININQSGNISLKWHHVGYSNIPV